MNLTPDKLEENGYVLLDQFGHKELVPFIQKYMKKRTKYSMIYFFSNMIAFGLAGFYFMIDFNSPSYDFGSRISHFAIGLTIALALIPIHEYIHVLAYKSQGAINTSYDVNLKKFYFMALADKFVANKKEFEVVGLAPFIVITISLVILLFVVNPHWMLTIIGTLLAHTAMCSGDFGLLSYFEFNKDKQIVTYDDVENEVSYFYGQANRIIPIEGI